MKATNQAQSFARQPRTDHILMSFAATVETAESLKVALKSGTVFDVQRYALQLKNQTAVLSKWADAL